MKLELSAQQGLSPRATASHLGGLPAPRTLELTNILVSLPPRPEPNDPPSPGATPGAVWRPGEAGLRHLPIADRAGPRAAGWGLRILFGKTRDHTP